MARTHPWPSDEDFSYIMTSATSKYNAKNCDHRGNHYWRNTLCSTTNKHYIMCTDCPHHLPALQYLGSHHNPNIGFQNFIMMGQCFGDQAYKAMCGTVSISVSNAAADNEIQNLASGSTDSVLEKSELSA